MNEAHDLAAHAPAHAPARAGAVVPRSVVPLLRRGVLDAELAALAWLLLDVRTPLVVVGPRVQGLDLVLDGMAGLLPNGAQVVTVAPDDDFEWLPVAAALGWREERPTTGSDAAQGSGSDGGRISADDGVLVARGLGLPAGVGGSRARIVVRALALGYGLLATMAGEGLDDVLDTLHDPAIGTDADERSRLGLVIVLGDIDEGGADGAGGRITSAHYVRPVALDTHGHVQRPAPAVLATWNAGTGRYDHFAWGVLPDLSGRTGTSPIEFEREQARRATQLASAAEPAR